MPSRSVAIAPLTALALLCSCSADERDQQRSEASLEGGPPNISPSAAPGVAFNYAYQFSLPDDRISATQEAHASACEKLGLSRCRITGMSYSIDQNEQVIAELNLKLHPLIARQFGKSAQQTVASNDGKLVRLDIGSSDEGQKIDSATKQKNETSAQLAELQQELARTRPGTEAYASLLTHIQALQRQASEQSEVIAGSEAALASTPMELHYYGRGGVPGFRGNPVREAWHTFVTIMVRLVGLLLQALAVLVPLALLAALLVGLWRARPVRAIRRWLVGAPDDASADREPS